MDWIEIRRAVGVKVRVKIKSKSKATDANVRSTWGNATSKQRGELAEMMFMVKAAQKGFATAKPYGDSRRYDFILDRAGSVSVAHYRVLRYADWQFSSLRA